MVLAACCLAALMIAGPAFVIPNPASAKSIKVTWKGEWSSGNVRYKKGNSVQHNGSLYISVKTHRSSTAFTPADDTDEIFWELMTAGCTSSCNDPVPTVTSATGRIWMDRNLGASRVARSYSDSAAYGWLYQWGRLTDGHEQRDSRTTTDLSGGDVPGHGRFITTDTSPRDWHVDGNDSLWQGVNGTSNPCPEGFRIPTEEEWQAEIDEHGADVDSLFNSPLKLVAAGYRTEQGGTLNGVAINGYYWSSKVDGSSATFMLSYPGGAGIYSTNRAYGHSVRCLKD